MASGHVRIGVKLVWSAHVALKVRDGLIEFEQDALAKKIIPHAPLLPSLDHGYRS